MPKRQMLEPLRKYGDYRWESQPADDMQFENLDFTRILQVRNLAIQNGRLSPKTSTKIEDVLDAFKLRRDGKLTNAAKILFRKIEGDVWSFKGPIEVKMARFDSISMGSGDIFENYQPKLNAFDLIQQSSAFLEKTLMLGTGFPRGRVFRPDRLPLLMEAFREVLVNAVIHRGQPARGEYLTVDVYTDRVGFTSFDSSIRGARLKNLLDRKIQAESCSPVIADMFYRIGWATLKKRGLGRVSELCKRCGIPPAEVEINENRFKVIFRLPIGKDTRDNAPDRYISSWRRGEMEWAARQQNRKAEPS